LAQQDRIREAGACSERRVRRRKAGGFFLIFFVGDFFFIRIGGDFDWSWKYKWTMI
jgi:hypothetical protein